MRQILLADESGPVHHFVSIFLSFLTATIVVLKNKDDAL